MDMATTTRTYKVITAAAGPPRYEGDSAEHALRAAAGAYELLRRCAIPQEQAPEIYASSDGESWDRVPGDSDMITNAHEGVRREREGDNYMPDYCRISWLAPGLEEAAGAWSLVLSRTDVGALLARPDGTVTHEIRRTTTDDRGLYVPGGRWVLHSRAPKGAANALRYEGRYLSLREAQAAAEAAVRG